MKYYIISDIHGSPVHLKKVLSYYDADGDYLVLLGDLLNHGPRNPLPEGYDPKEVAFLLNERKEKIIAVRGNCDSEVDQMLLEFPITADYQMLPFAGYKIFISHGHLYDENMKGLAKKDAVLFGHIHVPLCERKQHLYLNPGSISLPKQGSVCSFAVLENDQFTIFDVHKNIIKSVTIQ